MSDRNTNQATLTVARTPVARMTLACMTFASVLCGSAAYAEAAGGFWQIEGQLINVDQSGIKTHECEQPNVTLRFRSRWSDGQGCIAGPGGECPWGAWWGTTRTNASGRFHQTSPFFADASRGRDIEVQSQVQVGEWKTIKVVSNIGENPPSQQHNGIWRFNLGILKTNHFVCPTVLRATRPNDAPKLLPVPDPNPNGIGRLKAIKKNVRNQETEAGSTSVMIAEIPCGMAQQGGTKYDLAFESTAVRHRDNQPHAPIERITWEVVIRNNGPTPFKSSGKCRTSVRMSVYIPELEATRVYDMTLHGEIQPGATRKFTSNSGNLGEISEEASTSYNLKFEIDPDNNVLESNEANNIQPGCYTPSTGNYVEHICG